MALQANGPGSTFGAGPGAYDAHDSVAILRPDGSVLASASFKPRNLPKIGNAAPVVQPEARVAAGAVYFMDGDGVVRRLTVDGKVGEVTRFPAGQPQQEVSFAVSPDGRSLVATVLTLPDTNPAARTPLDPPFAPGSHTYLEVLTATSGGPARSLWRRDLGEGLNGVSLRVVGYDASGPLVTTRPLLGTQQGSLGNAFDGWALAHLDATGNTGPAETPGLGIGNEADACFPWQQLRTGAILCSGGGGDQVRLLKGGQVVWQLPPDQQAVFLTASPDASWIAYRGGARSKDGATLTLPASFFPEGWLDGSTIVGYLDPISFGVTVGNLATVSVSSCCALQDLGFKGVFVSTLS